MGIIQPLRPRTFVKRPEYLLRLADNTPDAVVKDGFGIGQVMQDISNRPLAWAIALSKVLIAQGVILERCCFCRFKFFDDFHLFSSNHFDAQVSRQQRLSELACPPATI